MPAPTTVLSMTGSRAAVSAARVADAAARLLVDAGAEVTRFEPGPRPSERPLDSWLNELIAGEITDVVLFSAQGVRLLYELARQTGREAPVLQALGRVRLISQGGRTDRALTELGLHAEVRARGRGTEALIEALSKLDLRGRVVALQPRDVAADAPLIQHLERAGAKVRTRGRARPADNAAKDLLEQLVGREFDGLLLLDAGEVAWLWDAAISEGSTGALREALAGVAIVAGEAAVAALRDRGVRAHVAPHGTLDGEESLEDLLPLLRAIPAAE